MDMSTPNSALLQMLITRNGVESKRTIWFLEKPDKTTSKLSRQLETDAVKLRSQFSSTAIRARLSHLLTFNVLSRQLHGR